MKKRMVSILVISLFALSSAQSIADLKFVTPSQVSVIVTGSVVLSPILVPVLSGKASVDESGEASAKSKDKKIKVKDKQGEDKTLSIPEEIADKVDVKEGDIVDLQEDENGVLMEKNNKAAYYFLKPEKAHLIGNEKIVK